jgi:hypothetical protein
MTGGGARHMAPASGEGSNSFLISHPWCLENGPVSVFIALAGYAIDFRTLGALCVVFKDKEKRKKACGKDDLKSAKGVPTAMRVIKSRPTS